MTVIALLAAGKSRRFGDPCKLQTSFRGKPLVRHAADVALALGRPVIAVVSDMKVAALLPEFHCIFSDGPKSQTLKAAASFAKDDDLLVMLADMPFIETHHLETLLDASGAAILTDGMDMYPPALIPESLFPAIMQLEGDQGAGKILRNHPTTEMIPADPSVLIDIDTQADLALFA